MEDRLTARYIASLRSKARENPHNLPPVIWVCPLCQLGSFQKEDAFHRHLQQLHADQLEEKRSDVNEDFDAWKDELKRKAFTVSQVEHAQIGQEREKAPPSPDRGASFGSSGLDRLNQLSLSSLQPATNLPAARGEVLPLEVSKSGQSSQSLLPVDRTSVSADDSIRVPSAQSGSTRNPRAQVPGRQSPSASARQRAIRPAPAATADPDFRRHTLQNRPVSRELYNPADEEHTDAKRKSPIASGPSLGLRRHQPTSRQRGLIDIPVNSRYPSLILQPDSRPISQEQLAAEVKSIYSGLTMIESKCVHLDKPQPAAIGKVTVSADHWRLLIGLHRTLLHEHHDFFLASQHPSASPALRRLAGKYNMPARMWKHGIHSFLELLRHHLPASLEFMVSFIYMAYQMMALLYETVPSFKKTWIECLGDLSRYRMAVEEDCPRDREVWAGVARFWYSQAADQMPTVGRLYHHLAILARPNNLQQLYLYSRALTSTQAFYSARESIQILFDPVMKDGTTFLSDIDFYFIQVHAMLYHRRINDVQKPLKSFYELLDSHIEKSHTKWRELGVYITVSNLCAMFDYGTNLRLRQVFEIGNQLLKQEEPVISLSLEANRKEPVSVDTNILPNTFSLARDFSFKTFLTILTRHGDVNVHPSVHVMLAFLASLASFVSFRLDSKFPDHYNCAKSILSRVPWHDLCHFLNAIARSEDAGTPRYETIHFIRPATEDVTPLPEDHLIRGEVFSQTYFPDDWFRNTSSEDEQRSIEHASTVKMREERIRWLGYILSTYGYMSYSPKTRKWTPCSGPAESIISPRVSSFSKSQIEPSSVVASVSVPENTSGDATMADPPGAIEDQQKPQPMEGVQTEGDRTDIPDEEDSPEMDEINSQMKAVSMQPTARNAASARWSAACNVIIAMLELKRTIMVCDTQLLIKDLDIFEYLVEEKWDVVVPNDVLANLHNISKTREHNSVAALKAVRTITMAISIHQPIVRIFNHKGDDVTKQTLDKGPPSETSSDTSDSDENLLKVTRRASDLGERKQEAHGPDSKAAVLLTDDRRTRAKAGHRGLASIATACIRSLMTDGNRKRSSSNGSARSHSPLAPELKS